MLAAKDDYDKAYAVVVDMPINDENSVHGLEITLRPGLDGGDIKDWKGHISTQQTFLVATTTGRVMPTNYRKAGNQKMVFLKEKGYFHTVVETDGS